MVHRRQTERGDTLVEVLLAIIILSMVIVGSITVMSRGLRSIQVASEHTQVRLQMTAQTEMLRYLRDGYLADSASTAGQSWSLLFGGGANPVYANTAASTYGACEVSAGKTPFYLTQAAGSVQINAFNFNNKPTTVALPGQGLWIEAQRSAAGIAPAYVDFQLRACWFGAGSSGEQQTVTVVRLYDPAH